MTGNFCSTPCSEKRDKKAPGTKQADLYYQSSLRAWPHLTLFVFTPKSTRHRACKSATPPVKSMLAPFTADISMFRYPSLCPL